MSGAGSNGRDSPGEALPGMDGIVRELRHALDPDFSGQVVIHCYEGRVTKFETRQVHRPREGEGVDLTE